MCPKDQRQKRKQNDRLVAVSPQIDNTLELRFLRRTRVEITGIHQ
jgi:hypothetical protein